MVSHTHFRGRRSQGKPVALQRDRRCSYSLLCPHPIKSHNPSPPLQPCPPLGGMMLSGGLQASASCHGNSSCRGLLGFPALPGKLKCPSANTRMKLGTVCKPEAQSQMKAQRCQTPRQGYLWACVESALPA